MTVASDGHAADPWEEIERYRRDVAADPRSLRFVQLADALRRRGRNLEAEGVLRQGLRHHPGLKNAELVLARVLATGGRRGQALALLDALYPRDPENLALIEVYVGLLLEEGRWVDATRVIDAAALSGALPERVREWRAQARKARPAIDPRPAALRAWLARIEPLLGGRDG